jgi:hypothetical protein
MKKLITLLVILFSTSVFAKELKDYNFNISHIPVACATNELITEFLIKEGLNAKTISLGKEGAEENGKPVFLITYYESLDKTKSASAVQVPNSDEVCILYYTFDLMDAPKEKGI